MDRSVAAGERGFAHRFGIGRVGMAGSRGVGPRPAKGPVDLSSPRRAEPYLPSGMDRSVPAGERGFAHRFGISRVCMAGPGEVFGGGAELHRDADLVN